MSGINLSPRDLEAVLAVAQHASFRAAAASLGVTQPSVSSRVQHAEDILGVKLFHRTTRRVEITAHGQRLVARAEQALAELRALAQEFRDEARLQRGRVVVGATPAIAASLLPAVIQKFRKRWPGIEVVLRDDFFSRALDRVHAGEIDVAVTPSVGSDDRFECEPLMQEAFVLFGRKDHPVMKEAAPGLKDIAGYPLIALPTGSATREILAQAFAAENLPFRPAFETHNLVSVVGMVKAGFGLAFMPEGIRAIFDMSAMRTVKIASPELVRTICLTRAKGRALQPAAQALVEALRTALKKR